MSLCFTRIELGLESSGSSNLGFLNMDYKKGLVCYISTCTYLKVALGLYKGVLIYYLYLLIYIYLVVLLMKNPIQFKLKNIQLIHP